MSILNISKESLLNSNGLNENHLNEALNVLLAKKVDIADIYMQSNYNESLVLEDGIIKTGSSSFEQGVGIRACVDEKSSLAYTEDLTPSAIINAATAASSIVTQSSTNVITSLTPKSFEKSLYKSVNPITASSIDDKINILRTAEAIIKQDKNVVQYSISLNAVYDTILVLDEKGQLSADVRPLIRLNVSVVLDKNGLKESGYSGGGGRDDYSFFTAEVIEYHAKEALRSAHINLEAKPAPAGNMTVVLGNGWSGILLHEAIGHGLEADSNRKKTSTFHNSMGEKIASDICTVVDDGTLANRRGSLNIDDEGNTTNCTTLIENGVLKNYISDRLNSKLMGTQSTGNGRRESYKYLPIPRMTNTYMLAGKSDPQEIIESVEYGLYAPSFGGGQVDTTSGNFVFSTSEAYIIEKGKLSYPVKGATLIGSGPEVLKRVSMVGNDMELDKGLGTCGKDGQCVPVGVGQPTLKIDELTVGGTN